MKEKKDSERHSNGELAHHSAKLRESYLMKRNFTGLQHLNVKPQSVEQQRSVEKEEETKAVYIALTDAHVEDVAVVVETHHVNTTRPAVIHRRDDFSGLERNVGASIRITRYECFENDVRGNYERYGRKASKPGEAACAFEISNDTVVRSCAKHEQYMVNGTHIMICQRR